MWISAEPVESRLGVSTGFGREQTSIFGDNIRKRLAQTPRSGVVSPVVAATLSLLASVSHAQSSVTLYGIIDTGVEYINKTGAGSLARVVSGNVAGSRWGMKGSESRGGSFPIFTLRVASRQTTGR